jgi:hypothetical protein
MPNQSKTKPTKRTKKQTVIRKAGDQTPMRPKAANTVAIQKTTFVGADNFISFSFHKMVCNIIGVQCLYKPSQNEEFIEYLILYYKPKQ